MPLAQLAMTETGIIDNIDRQIIAATQKGLPLSRNPYHVIAQQLGLQAEDVIQRMKAMQDKGIIRRIGVIPNHYKLGYKSNGMSVWNIADDDIRESGKLVGSLDFVSHCYQRPRFLPEWPYNLFAMVHGKSHDEVIAKVNIIAELLGDHNRGHEILFSTKILKKTGLRIG